MIKKLSIVLIVALATLTVAGVVVGIIVYNKNNDLLANNETIIVNEKEYTEFNVDLAGIAPGDIQSYIIPMTVTEAGQYDVVLAFEKGELDSLAKYLDAEIKLNGEKIDGANLSEYLQGKQTVIELDLEESTRVEVEIVYAMGLDVGDEAQNTKADFKLTLTVER